MALGAMRNTIDFLEAQHNFFCFRRNMLMTLGWLSSFPACDE
jgi:hypothetical protein